MLLVITQRKYDRATQHSYLRSISIFPMLFSKFIRNLQELIFYLFILKENKFIIIIITKLQNKNPCPAKGIYNYRRLQSLIEFTLPR